MPTQEKTKKTKKINVQPLGNRLVVEPIEAEEVTSSGIVIPDTAKEKQQRGIVAAAGKGKVTDEGKLIPLEVKVGDEVLYGKYSGTEIKIRGDEYLIINEDDVFGIIR